MFCLENNKFMGELQTQATGFPYPNTVLFRDFAILSRLSSRDVDHHRSGAMPVALYYMLRVSGNA